MYTRTTGCLHRSCPSGVQSIAAGGFYSLVLKRDGTVWATGGNWAGQLGDGTSGTWDCIGYYCVLVSSVDKNTFVQCTGLSGR